MTEEQPGVERLNTNWPNVARIWDANLGGKDNFGPDREAAADINAMCKEAGVPDGAAVAHETRDWLRRAIALLVQRGIEQFIDLGVGLPASENVHQFARKLNPAARTVYVDNDDMVMAHGRALLADNRSTVAVQGDLRHPITIFQHKDLQSLVQLDRPVAVLLVAVLDLIPDEEAIASVIAQIGKAVAPGSYLAITHATTDRHPVAADALADAYVRLQVNTPMVPRPGSQIRQFFAGWDLVEPGLVSPALWHPELADRHRPEVEDTGWTYAGIGYLNPQRQLAPSSTAAQAKTAQNIGHQNPPGHRRGPASQAGAAPRRIGSPVRAGAAMQTRHQAALMPGEDRS